MFGEKCSRCSKRVSKKYDFCPYCGINLNAESNLDNGDFGFLGKDDFDMKLPFGFKALMKPLMKELSKQMLELDKEIKREEGYYKDKAEGKRAFSNFSIHIGIPGQKPIRINSFPLNSNQVVRKNKFSGLPKIDSKKLDKIKNLARKEPITTVRRLSDKIIYDIGLPGVRSLEDIDIAKLEDSIEIKAIAKDCLFLKVLDVTFPLKSYSFKDEKLILNLGLR